MENQKQKLHYKSIESLKSNSELDKQLLDSAIELYISVFASEPYNEDFKYEDVKEDFLKYIYYGKFIVCFHEDKVVGLICISKGYNVSSQIQSILETNDIDSKNDWYISELAVHEKYRKNGIGKTLVKHFFDCHPQKAFLRTGLIGNECVIKFYEKYGFKTLHNATENVSNPRIDGTIKVDERVYMIYKSYDESRYEGDGYQSGSEGLYG